MTERKWQIPLYLKNISLTDDTIEIELEIPEDINFTYKDKAGFAKLCAELFIEKQDYSFVEKKTIDILIDFARE